jgi:hypothetical protein
LMIEVLLSLSVDDNNTITVVKTRGLYSSINII